MKINGILLILALVLLTLGGPAFGQSVNTGAVAKIPYPMMGEGITLEKQRVNITVYSTFIRVEGEYTVRNTGPDNTVTFGFPIYKNPKEPSKNEFSPLSMDVTRGKGKGSDIYVARKVEGDPDSGSPYKEWFLWDISMRSKGTARFNVEYYLKMSREKGVPHFTYTLQQAEAYSGKTGLSSIEVNMPITCTGMPFTAAPLYDGSAHVFVSLPRAKVQGNILAWEMKDHSPLGDLKISFYKKGFPDWEVTCSSGEMSGHSCLNVLDGDPQTFWMSADDKGGIGQWLQFKPIVRDASGKGSSFTPLVKGIGIIPGNITTLSDFYNFGHLKEGEVEVVRKASPKKEENKPIAVPGPTAKPRNRVDVPGGIEKTPEFGEKKKKGEKQEVILLDCLADPVLQVFFAKKKPLPPVDGSLKMTVTMTYQGQLHKNLCISEVLIFDREPKEVYQW
jgi:hypothetical protein